MGSGFSVFPEEEHIYVLDSMQGDSKDNY